MKKPGRRSSECNIYLCNLTPLYLLILHVVSLCILYGLGTLGKINCYFNLDFQWSHAIPFHSAKFMVSMHTSCHHPMALPGSLLATHIYLGSTERRGNQDALGEKRTLKLPSDIITECVLFLLFPLGGSNQRHFVINDLNCHRCY